MVVVVWGLSGCGKAPPPRWVVATPAVAMPFCTRTLGMAECFADPAGLPDRPQGLGDTPVRVHREARPWWRVLD
jgi:hypothetical protein